MNDFKYVSDDYNINKTITYRLSIQLNPDGFSVLIADAHKNILFLFHRETGSMDESRRELKEIPDLLPLTNLRFATAVLLINTPEFTIVPAQYYTEGNKELFFRYNHPLEATGQLRVSRMAKPDAFLIYKLNRDHLSFLNSFHNSPAIDHSSIPYLDYISSEYNEEEALFLHHTGKLLSLSLFRKNRLELHNIIQASDENDIVYHTLNTLKQLGINRETCKIIYSGTLGEGSEAVKMLSKYIEHIDPVKNDFPFELAGELNENYFINLLKSSGCV